MNKRNIRALAVATLACVVGGCATIFTGGGTQKVSVTSTPPGAQVSIANRAGQVVSTGTTPYEAKLKRGAGYFKSESYTLNFTMPGYQPTQARLTPRISGWYFGNIAIGGLLGMVAIDPATGAMYKLEPKDVAVTLQAMKVAAAPDDESLVVVATTRLPADVLERMTLLDIH